MLRFLAEHGLAAFALSRSGLRREPPDAERPGAHNVLALSEAQESHRSVLERLRGVRFPHNQNA